MCLPEYLPSLPLFPLTLCLAEHRLLGHPFSSAKHLSFAECEKGTTQKTENKAIKKAESLVLTRCLFTHGRTLFFTPAMSTSTLFAEPHR